MIPLIGTTNERHEHPERHERHERYEIPEDLYWNLTACDAPEADLTAVASYDFRRLSLPLLVACYNQTQLDDFTRMHGLLRCEVRRLSASHQDVLATMRADKILLLLPGWDQDARTKRLADKWIFELDRYTVTLRSPRPMVPVMRWRSVILLAAKILILPLILLAATLAWLVLR